MYDITNVVCRSPLWASSIEKSFFMSVKIPAKEKEKNEKELVFWSEITVKQSNRWWSQFAEQYQFWLMFIRKRNFVQLLWQQNDRWRRTHSILKRLVSMSMQNLCSRQNIRAFAATEMYTLWTYSNASKKTMESNQRRKWKLQIRPMPSSWRCLFLIADRLSRSSSMRMTIPHLSIANLFCKMQFPLIDKSQASSRRPLILYAERGCHQHVSVNAWLKCNLTASSLDSRVRNKKSKDKGVDARHCFKCMQSHIAQIELMHRVPIFSSLAKRLSWLALSHRFRELVTWQKMHADIPRRHLIFYSERQSEGDKLNVNETGRMHGIIVNDHNHDKWEFARITNSFLVKRKHSAMILRFFVIFDSRLKFHSSRHHLNLWLALNFVMIDAHQ